MTCFGLINNFNSLWSQVIGEILCRGDETHNEKIELAKPETDKEGLLYYGLGKGISSSTSSGPQNNEKNVCSLHFSYYLQHP